MISHKPLFDFLNFFGIGYKEDSQEFTITRNGNFTANF
jgi:hypothetical protein